MALNTLKCNCLIPLHFEGLNRSKLCCMMETCRDRSILSYITTWIDFYSCATCLHSSYYTHHCKNLLLEGDWSTEREQGGTGDWGEIPDSYVRAANSSIPSRWVDRYAGSADPLCRNVELLQTGSRITQSRYARNLPSSPVWKGWHYVLDLTLIVESLWSQISVKRQLNPLQWPSLVSYCCGIFPCFFYLPTVC